MRVAVICEYSGRVRDAFIRKGHEAISFDLIESESDLGEHVIGDVRKYPLGYWECFDLAVCHPPCTHLAVSGARYFKDKVEEQREALEFVQWLMDLPIAKICIENPIGVISSKIRKPDQIIQPWMFGERESKSTCLWLKGLDRLVGTNVLQKPECGYWDNCTPSGQNKLGPSEDRWKIRSRTYLGIAEAFAEQFGGDLNAKK